MQNSAELKLKQLAGNKHLAQSWIISGSDSAGRLDFIKKFINWLFCTENNLDKPCNNCKNCHLFASDTHPDLFCIDAKLEEIRNLHEFLPGQSQIANYKAVIIKDCEQLNLYASNALLKNLEEPGKNKLIFLLVPHPGMLINTIISRCQQLSLGDIGIDEDFSYELSACLITKTMNYQQLIEKLSSYSNLQVLYFLESSAAKLIKSGVSNQKLWDIIDTSYKMRKSILNKQSPNIEILLEQILN